MLAQALDFLAGQINEHLLKRQGTPVGTARAGMLVNEQGVWAQEVDSLQLTLFQVEEERALREQLPERVLVGGREVLLAPRLRLNLIVVVAARFRQYGQALESLSRVLALFQARPLFTRDAYPGMPEGIERLALELMPLGTEQMNQLWACLGARHLPSAVWRVRMVALRDDEPVGTGAPIVEIDTVLQGHGA